MEEQHPPTSNNKLYNYPSGETKQILLWTPAGHSSHPWWFDPGLKEVQFAPDMKQDFFFFF